MYVPSLDTPMDLNEDGILDVAFYKKLPTKVNGVTYVEVSPLISGKPNSQLLAGDTSGELTWLKIFQENGRKKTIIIPFQLTT